MLEKFSKGVLYTSHSQQELVEHEVIVTLTCDLRPQHNLTVNL